METVGTGVLLGKFRVEFGDPHIRLRQRHLSITHQGLEEGPFLVHLLEQGEALLLCDDA